MDRQSLNRRSPLRVFERSIHGGLGRGNIGVVMGRAGTGRRAFLVDLGLDGLLNDRRVLHVSTRASADKVLAFYEEIFRDLAESVHLEDRLRVHLQVERNRMIHTFVDHSFTLERITRAANYMKQHMHFEPGILLFDGFPDWEKTSADELAALKDLAGQLQCEIWLEAKVHREGDELDARGVPLRIARFEEHLSVLLRLQQNEDHVRLQLLKDHDNPDVADVHIELDPRTLLMVWQ
jgi:hypothetical protein